MTMASLDDQISSQPIMVSDALKTIKIDCNLTGTEEITACVKSDGALTVCFIEALAPMTNTITLLVPGMKP